MIYKYFLLVYGLSFHSLYSIFWGAEDFKFCSNTIYQIICLWVMLLIFISKKIFLTWWFSMRDILLPRGYLASLITFLVVTTGKVLLASNGERSGMLLNFLNEQDIPSRQKIIWLQMSVVLSLKNSGLSQSQKYFPFVFFILSIILDFTFRSKTYFKLLFCICYEILITVSLVLSYIWMLSCSSIICWKTYSSCIDCILVKNKLLIYIWFYFWISYSIDPFAYFYSNIILDTDYYTFRNKSWY